MSRQTGIDIRGRRFLAAVIAATLFVQSIISLLAATIPILAPYIALDRGWNATLIALYPALVVVTAFITSFYVPLFLTRLGGMTLSLGCICASAGGLLCVTSPVPAIVVLAPLAIGIAAAAMNPASSQILAQRTPVHMTGFVMSLKQMGVPLGMALAGVILPFFVSRFQWMLTVTGLAFVSVAIAVVLWPASRRLDKGSLQAPASRQASQPIRQLLTIRGMPQFLVAGMTAGAAQYCLRSFYPVYLVKNLGLDLSKAGIIFSVSQGAGIFGQLAWASLSDRTLRAHTTIGLIGLTITVASVLSALFTHDWPFVGIIITATLFGVSAAAYMPVVLAEVARKAPSGQAGALTSSTNVFLFAGSGIGPLIFGGIAEYLSYPAAFVSLAAAAALSGCLALSFREADGSGTYLDATANIRRPT